MPPDSFVCQAWRSPALPETYLLADREEGLARVPAALLERFGTPEPATSFVLHGGRRLARAEAVEVMRCIREQGYYLQLPPPRDVLMAALAARNDKLPR